MESTYQVGVYVEVLNLATRINKSRSIVKLFLRGCKCRLHGKKCNTNGKLN